LGIRRFTALSYAHRPGMAADLTDSALDLAATEPDCVPSAKFFPEEGVLDQVRSALGWGGRVFKIHALVGGFDLREPILDEVWGVLSDASVHVGVHVGSGPFPRAGFTGPDKLESDATPPPPGGCGRAHGRRSTPNSRLLAHREPCIRAFAQPAQSKSGDDQKYSEKNCEGREQPQETEYAWAGKND
jgi:hypothetical protein